MLKQLTFFFCVILVICCSDNPLLSLSKPSWSLQPIDFDLSMGKGTKGYENCLTATRKNNPYSRATYPRPAKDLLDFFRALYEKNNLMNVEPSQHPKIPLIAHMIWSGGVFPVTFHAFRKSWIEKHPDWTHILWVDNPINYNFGTVIEDMSHFKEDLSNGVYAGRIIVATINNFTLINQRFYDQSNNVGERTDILKYELVYNFGGVYIDTDFECLQQLDILHHCYDFYIGIQPLDEGFAVGLGLFAAVPGHQILKHCIDTIENDRREGNVVSRTGPYHATKSFWAVAPNCPGVTVALPATYFYPVGLKQKNISRQEMLGLLKPESFGLHHWAGSWLPR